VISGVHAIVFSPEAEKVRAFFADVLELPSVDAGGGWLIFALPPAELAVHPADGATRHELYLMCDDIHATLADLRGKGVEVAQDVSDQGWGLLASVRLPKVRFPFGKTAAVVVLIADQLPALVDSQMKGISNLKIDKMRSMQCLVSSEDKAAYALSCRRLKENLEDG